MKIYKALIYLEKICPNLFALVKHVKIDACNHPSACIQATKEGFTVKINEQWINSFDSHNLAAIIEHELLHAILAHCNDSRYSDKQTANIAMDAIINEMANTFQDRKKLNSELSNGIFLDDLNSAHDTRFSLGNSSVMDIYNHLMGLKKEEREKFNSFDEGLTSNDTGNQSANDALKELSDKMSEVVGEKDLEGIVKDYGTNSKELKSFFEGLAIKKIDNRVKKAFESFFSSLKESFRKTIKKPSKRFAGIPYGRTPNIKQKILMALDVSASMLDDATRARLQTSVNTAIKYQYSVDLIWGDTKKIGEAKNVKKNFDFNTVNGGGGTELSFIFDEKINSYDIVAIVTDGYFNTDVIPHKHKNKIVFLNTDREVKNFKNIYLT